jgi:hypothetical protein
VAEGRLFVREGASIAMDLFRACAEQARGEMIGLGFRTKEDRAAFCVTTCGGISTPCRGVLRKAAPSDEAVAIVLPLYIPSANITAFDALVREPIDAACKKGLISREVLREPPASAAFITSFIASRTSKASEHGKLLSDRRALAAR